MSATLHPDSPCRIYSTKYCSYLSLLVLSAMWVYLRVFMKSLCLDTSIGVVNWGVVCWRYVQSRFRVTRPVTRLKMKLWACSSREHGCSKKGWQRKALLTACYAIRYSLDWVWAIWAILVSLSYIFFINSLFFTRLERIMTHITHIEAKGDWIPKGNTSVNQMGIFEDHGM